MTQRPNYQRFSIVRPVLSEQRTAFRIKVAAFHTYTSIINTVMNRSCTSNLLFSQKNIGIDVSIFYVAEIDIS